MIRPGPNIASAGQLGLWRCESTSPARTWLVRAWLRRPAHSWNWAWLSGACGTRPTPRGPRPGSEVYPSDWRPRSASWRLDIPGSDAPTSCGPPRRPKTPKRPSRPYPPSLPQVQQQMAYLTERHQTPLAWTRHLSADSRALSQYHGMMHSVHERVIKPHWPQIDMPASAKRARMQVLAEDGIDSLLASLDPRRIRWSPPVLELASPRPTRRPPRRPRTASHTDAVRRPALPRRRPLQRGRHRASAMADIFPTPRRAAVHHTSPCGFAPTTILVRLTGTHPRHRAVCHRRTAELQHDPARRPSRHRHRQRQRTRHRPTLGRPDRCGTPPQHGAPHSDRRRARPAQRRHVSDGCCRESR